MLTMLTMTSSPAELFESTRDATWPSCRVAPTWLVPPPNSWLPVNAPIELNLVSCILNSRDSETSTLRL